ncbi:uncharacterized protein LOC133360355 [Lethenteron reissneri]|uniref:uncharacterized protein LOC133360355 n=1 Tax=Lethenteron reissneri TaxID=7753 RepID=UPI002AB6561B|nr:uncharacterized protein LOC133360355 [Lethenteron reissneri]
MLIHRPWLCRLLLLLMMIAALCRRRCCCCRQPEPSDSRSPSRSIIHAADRVSRPLVAPCEEVDEAASSPPQLHHHHLLLLILLHDHHPRSTFSASSEQPTELPRGASQTLRRSPRQKRRASPSSAQPAHVQQLHHGGKGGALSSGCSLSSCQVQNLSHRLYRLLGKGRGPETQRSAGKATRSPNSFGRRRRRRRRRRRSATRVVAAWPREGRRRWRWQR